MPSHSKVRVIPLLLPQAVAVLLVDEAEPVQLEQAAVLRAVEHLPEQPAAARVLVVAVAQVAVVKWRHNRGCHSLDPTRMGIFLLRGILSLRKKHGADRQIPQQAITRVEP